MAERSSVSLSTLKLHEREGKDSLQRLAKVAAILNLEEGHNQLFREIPAYTSLDQVQATHRRPSESP